MMCLENTPSALSKPNAPAFSPTAQDRIPAFSVRLAELAIESASRIVSMRSDFPPKFIDAFQEVYGRGAQPASMLAIPQLKMLLPEEFLASVKVKIVPSTDPYQLPWRAFGITPAPVVVLMEKQSLPEGTALRDLYFISENQKSDLGANLRQLIRVAQWRTLGDCGYLHTLVCSYAAPDKEPQLQLSAASIAQDAMRTPSPGKIDILPRVTADLHRILNGG